MKRSASFIIFRFRQNFVCWFPKNSISPCKWLDPEQEISTSGGRTGAMRCDAMRCVACGRPVRLCQSVGRSRAADHGGNTCSSSQPEGTAHACGMHAAPRPVRPPGERVDGEGGSPMELCVCPRWPCSTAAAAEAADPIRPRGVWAGRQRARTCTILRSWPRTCRTYVSARAAERHGKQGAAILHSVRLTAETS